jgi:predicted nucleotidyltransferase
MPGAFIYGSRGAQRGLPALPHPAAVAVRIGAHGTSWPDSDVDLLVEFEPDAKPTLLTMAQIELELSPLLRGRKVDLRTANDLSRYFRDEVGRSAQVQYEAG